MLPGLTYAEPKAERLHLDLFLPRDGEGPFPAVLFAPGAGWDRSQFWRQGVYMAQKGYIAATIQYRPSHPWVKPFEPGTTFPAGLNDLQEAIRWLRTNAKQFHVDPVRIAVAGGSGGGYLAALVGTNQWSGSNWSGATSDSRVQAVVVFNTPMDLPALAANLALKNVLGATYEENPRAWQDASPATHLGANTVPFLMLHGTSDQDVPYVQSVNMQAKLRELGIRAELFTAEGAGHGFFNNPPWYEPTLVRMEEFLSAVLK
jgi:acetyl esterase/lipase